LAAQQRIRFACGRFSASKEGPRGERDMDSTITEEILNDLIPSLEALETKSAAVLEFLKKEGIASDEKLAPYLEQAASASNVRWLAVRVRMERLLSSVENQSEDKKPEHKEADKEAIAESKSTEPAKTTSAETQSEEESQPTGQEKSAENGDKAKQAVPKELGTQAAAGNGDPKRGHDGEGDSEAKSTVSTTGKKVA
jgi:hypothetical protein